MTQELIALILVAAATAWLVRGWLSPFLAKSAGKPGGCPGGCACPASKAVPPPVRSSKRSLPVLQRR